MTAESAAKAFIRLKQVLAIFFSDKNIGQWDP